MIDLLGVLGSLCLAVAAVLILGGLATAGRQYLDGRRAHRARRLQGRAE